MNYSRHGWEASDDEPRKPFRLANWHRLPFRAFWVLISLALLALVLMGVAVTAGMTPIP